VDFTNASRESNNLENPLGFPNVRDLVCDSIRGIFYLFEYFFIELNSVPSFGAGVLANGSRVDHEKIGNVLLLHATLFQMEGKVPSYGGEYVKGFYLLRVQKHLINHS